DVTEGPAELLRGLGGDPDDPRKALTQIASTAPELLIFLEPMLGVTLTPTMAHASDKINVIPSQAWLKVDCRVPPGLGEDAVQRRIAHVLGDAASGYEIEFTEQVTGNASPVSSPLMDAI